MLDECPHGGVPTLTEVVELKPPQGAAPGAAPHVSDDEGPGGAVTEPRAEPTQAVLAPPAAAAVDADALVAQVLSELAPRIDLMFEARLREALAPALAQAADALIRDTRGGLSATLRELVQEAVVRALRRRAGQ